jgi:hypothetical protein
MRTQDGQQQRLPMSHTHGKDTSKTLLDTDMYIDVDRSQTRRSRGGRWPIPARVGDMPDRRVLGQHAPWSNMPFRRLCHSVFRTPKLLCF